MATESDHLLAAAQTDVEQHMSMYRMEERRRHRLMISLAVVALVSGMMGALLVWRLHVANTRRRAELPTLVASGALNQLNRHINLQTLHVPKHCTSTLLIIRHCEKDGPFTTDKKDNTEHCSYIGYQRAAYLATLFGTDPQARWPPPAHLFALTPDRGNGDHLNFREWETIQPLSDQTGIVTEIHNRASLPKTFLELLQSGSLCDQAAIVSWKHEFIPELAQQLGCGPHNGCPESYPEDSYDQVWQLTYTFHPRLPSLRDEDDLRHATSFTPFNGNEYEDPVDDDDDNGGPNMRRQRLLKHHSGDFSRHGWNVYATINYQNFDPLAFSKATREANAAAATASSSSSHNKGRKTETRNSYNEEEGL